MSDYRPTDSEASVTDLSTGDWITGQDVHGLQFEGRLTNKPYLFNRDQSIWLFRLDGGRQFLSKVEKPGPQPSPNFTASDGFEARI
ncbi:MAG: hypothetical protein NVSMB39_7430 [Candidatus Saccharimonadales bacterium]